MPNKLHPDNEKRADWALLAVDTFAEDTYCGRIFTNQVIEENDDPDGDAYAMIQDLIGDLLHLTVRHGWDPKEMIEKAVSNFDHENDPEYDGD